MVKWPLFYFLFHVKRLSSPSSLPTYAFKNGFSVVKTVNLLAGTKRNVFKIPRKNLINIRTPGREGVKGRCMWLFFLSPKWREWAFKCSASFLWDCDPEWIPLVVDVGPDVCFSNNLDRHLFLLLVIVRIPMNREISGAKSICFSPVYLLVYSTFQFPFIFKDRNCLSSCWVCLFVEIREEVPFLSPIAL